MKSTDRLEQIERRLKEVEINIESAHSTRLWERFNSTLELIIFILVILSAFFMFFYLIAVLFKNPESLLYVCVTVVFIIIMRKIM